MVFRRPGRQRLGGWICAIGAPPLLCAALLPLGGSLNLVSDALLFVAVSVAVAALGGLWPSLVSAVSGALLLNFFFTAPLHTLTIDDPNNAVALLVFVVVATTVGVAVDLIARHRRRLEAAADTEAALTQATALRTALLAAVGHDLRSPLAAAKASVSSMLSPELELSEVDRRELLETADDALDRLTGLVANLLDVSRLQTGSLHIALEPTDVDETLSRAQGELEATSSVRVALPEHLPPVLADPGLLERILANVLANAMRFSPTGIPPRVNATIDGGHVELRIIDHGPGVSAEQLETMFAPFQRQGDTDPASGLGLGLALSRGLAEAMGGTLRAEPTPGGGLTMILRLAAGTLDERRAPGERERESLS